MRRYRQYPRRLFWRQRAQLFEAWQRWREIKQSIKWSIRRIFDPLIWISEANIDETIHGNLWDARRQRMKQSCYPDGLPGCCPSCRKLWSMERQEMREAGLLCLDPSPEEERARYIASNQPPKHMKVASDYFQRAKN